MRLIIFLFLAMCFKYSSAQIDTLKLIQSAQLMIVPEKGLRNLEDWQKILPTVAKVEFLNSKGFGRSTFLKIKYRPFKDDSLRLKMIDSLVEVNNTTIYCDYIVVYYGGVFYRLLGFVNNDFYNFLTEFSKTSETGIDIAKNLFSISDPVNFKNQLIKRGVFVAGLDLICLQSYYLAQKMVNKKLKNNTCISSCEVRDRKKRTGE